MRCAWVVLVMAGRTYVPGALVVAASLRAVGTRHDRVVMVTPDVDAAARAQLALEFTAVVEVPYIERPARRFESAHQMARYGAWLDRSFTKWNCLGLTTYDRVLLVDADMVFVAPADELFDLPPPAACFSLPYLAPWRRRGGLPNPYIEPGATDMTHGAAIPASTIIAALGQHTVVAGGFLVLLRPDRADLDGLLAMLGPAGAAERYGAAFLTKSGPDEASISEYFAGVRGQGWTHIHQRYAAIPWKPEWVSRDVRAYHYLGRKPWDMDPAEFPDLAPWWRTADELASRHGDALAGVFGSATVTTQGFGSATQSSGSATQSSGSATQDSGSATQDSAAAAPLTAELAAELDAAVAELRLTADLRSMVLGAARAAGGARDQLARPDIDACLERWLLAMAQTRSATPHPWARVYRRTGLEDEFNNKLVGELVASRAGLVKPPAAAADLVCAMLARVDARLNATPTAIRAAVELRGDTLSYGSAYSTPAAPLRRLVRQAGAVAALRVALRYDTVAAGGCQWALPRAHVDELAARHGVGGEAFASPLNSRLLGRAGARVCSLFRDTDAAFGCVGEFGAADLAGTNWVVNPPFVEEILAAAARRVLSHLDSGAAETFFFIVPYWADSEAYTRLSSSPHNAVSLRLEPGSYFFEDAGGGRRRTKATSHYFALKRAATDEDRVRLAGALASIRQ
jgi:hypothetical protein